MTDHCCCPTCGAKLEKQFAWSDADRTFTTPIGRARFTKIHAAIFNAIWRAGKGGIHDRERFMEAVYGDRPEGGPEGFNTLSVHLIRLRERLEPVGYTITHNMGNPRRGWRLVKIEEAA